MDLPFSCGAGQAQNSDRSAKRISQGLTIREGFSSQQPAPWRVMTTADHPGHAEMRVTPPECLYYIE